MKQSKTQNQIANAARNKHIKAATSLRRRTASSPLSWYHYLIPVRSISCRRTAVYVIAIIKLCVIYTEHTTTILYITDSCSICIQICEEQQILPRAPPQNSTTTNQEQSEQ